MLERGNFPLRAVDRRRAAPAFHFEREVKRYDGKELTLDDNSVIQADCIPALSAHTRDAFSPVDKRYVTEIAARPGDVEGEVLANHSQRLTGDWWLRAKTKRAPNTFHDGRHVR